MKLNIEHNNISNLNNIKISDSFIKSIKDNHISDGNKRTFERIRNSILIFLFNGQKTINQTAQGTGINWKTVENHLTYLLGKKLVTEIFSSKYVRIFELTSEGNSYLTELKKAFEKEHIIRKEDSYDTLLEVIK